MANTNMDYQYPEFWAAGFDKLDVGTYEFQNLVRRDVEDTIAKSGDTVNVMMTPDLGTADDWTPGGTITPTGVTQEQTQVVLDKSKRKTIALTSSELSKSPYELIEIYGVALAKTILKAINLDLYLELMKTQYLVNGLSGIDEDKIIDAKALLDKNEVTLDGRFLVASPDEMGAMLKLDTFQHANTAGTDQAQKEGVIARKFGFAFYMNNIISKYTPADVAGAMNGDIAEAIATLACTSFNDDANPIRAGDLFLTADATVPTYGYHVVKSTTLTTSDTTGITFTPAAQAGGMANGKVITVTPSYSTLCFHPSACALAARAYAPLPVPGVKSVVMMLKGLPVRISVWNDSDLNVRVQHDILYGVKMYKESRCVRIIRA